MVSAYIIYDIGRLYHLFQLSITLDKANSTSEFHFIICISYATYLRLKQYIDDIVPFLSEQVLTLVIAAITRFFMVTIFHMKKI